MKDMLAELNQMLEQRERGEEPDFDGFMERYGDFFPGNPQTLDELLEQMAQSMAADAAAAQLDDARAARAAAGARRVAARGHGPALAGRPAVAQPPAGVPEHAVGPAAELQRRRPAAVRPDVRAARRRSATSTSSRTCCRTATQPGELAEVDIDQARELLGDDAARSLERLQRAGARCSRTPGSSSSARAGYELTPQGRPRRIGQQGARRPLPQADEGPGRPPRARAHRRRPRARLRAQALRVRRPVPPQRASRRCKNAIWRQGSGTPVRLSPDDFEVERTEMLTRSATVLMLDVSLSMPMRDNFLPAKKVAMALHALITTPVPARLLRARRRSGASRAR